MPTDATTVIRAASAADADELVAVIREGFEPQMQAMMIYGCKGMAEFVRDTLRLTSEYNDRVYTIAEHPEGGMAGAVELRRLPDALMLNYIAVSERYRARGLASRLLREAILQAGGDRYARMRLDVLATNRRARGWYDRLGFEPEFETAWWAVLPGEPSGRIPTALVGGFAHAEATQRRFGFSQLDIHTSRGSYAVGRMGDLWFRLTQPEALGDADLLEALAALDPGRRILALLRDGALPEELPRKVQSVARTIRMQVPLDSLLDRLAERSPGADPPRLPLRVP